jgi:hypothetical protein
MTKFERLLLYICLIGITCHEVMLMEWLDVSWQKRMIGAVLLVLILVFIVKEIIKTK